MIFFYFNLRLFVINFWRPWRDGLRRLNFPLRVWSWPPTNPSKWKKNLKMLYLTYNEFWNIFLAFIRPLTPFSSLGIPIPSPHLKEDTRGGISRGWRGESPLALETPWWGLRVVMGGWLEGGELGSVRQVESDLLGWRVKVKIDMLTITKKEWRVQMSRGSCQERVTCQRATLQDKRYGSRVTCQGWCVKGNMPRWRDKSNVSRVMC